MSLSNLRIGILRLINAFPHEYSVVLFPKHFRENFFKENDLVEIRKIKAQIVKLELERLEEVSSYFDGVNSITSKISTCKSQLLIQRNLYSSSFARAYMLSKLTRKPMLYALPGHWIEILIKNKIPVQSKASKIMFQIDCIVESIISTARNLNVWYLNLRQSSIVRNISKENCYVYFHNINEVNIENQLEDRFYTLTHWYRLNVESRRIEITANNHKYTKVYTHIFKPFSTYSPKIEFKIAFLSLLKVLNLLRAKHIQVIESASIYYQIMNFYRTLHSRLNYESVVFNASAGIRKPLWVHALEVQKVPVDFVFYTSWLEPEHRNGINSSTALWNISTWSSYFVYDRIQSDFLRRQCQIPPLPSVQYLGSPWWSDSKFDMEMLDGKTIVFFDNATSPHLVGDIVTEEYGFRSSKYQAKLLEIVVKTCVSMGFKVVHKTKRKFSTRYTDETYIRCIRSLETQYSNFYFLIDGPVAVEKLAMKCKAVIAFPFSSSGVAAQVFNKNVAYFDFSAMAHRDDPNLRGLKLILCEKELELWLGNLN